MPGSEDLGTWLRDLRRRRGMSQEQLAERATLSVRTIRDLEAGRVQQPRPSSARLLARALELDDSDAARLTVGAGTQVGPGSAAVPSPLTKLFGREPELASLAGLFSMPHVRLMTITGVAGVGKTRLLVEFLRSFRSLPETVWWVCLARLDDARHVSGAIAEAGGTSGDAAKAIGGRDALLALDNLEHIAGVGEVLLELLARCPRLRIIATSRRPLRLTGEQEWLLGPLRADTADAPAVELFLDRLRAVRPSWSVTPERLAEIAALCARLDGVPLAVELAAVNCRVLDPAELLAAASLLDLPARDQVAGHGSLRAALEVTFDLLQPAARRALGHLAVFRGGWTIGAARAVLGEVDAADALDELVAHGLVGIDDAGRFYVLQVIREYAGPTVEPAVARRHARYFAQWAIPRGERVEVWQEGDLSELDAERDNLRVALRWLAAHDRAAAAQLAVALTWYWSRRGLSREGLGWLRPLLDDDTDDGVLRGRMLLSAAKLAQRAGEGDAEELARRALPHLQAAGDHLGEARVYLILGACARYDLRFDEADRLHRASLRAAERLGDRSLVAVCMVALAATAQAQGRVKDTKRYAQRVLDLVPDKPNLTVAASGALCEAARLSGDLDLAERLNLANPDLPLSGGDLMAQVVNLSVAAVIAAGQGRLDDARRYAARASELADTEQDKCGSAARWATAEVALAAGEPAAEHFAAAADQFYRMGDLIGVVEALSGLAVSTPDPGRAAEALGRARTLADKHSITVPAAIAARLAAASGRGA